MLPFDDSIT